MKLQNIFGYAGFSDLGLDTKFFRSRSDSGRLLGSFLEIILKYNVPEEHSYLWLTDSEKTSTESLKDLQGSLPAEGFRVSHLEKVKFLIQSGQLQN